MKKYPRKLAVRVLEDVLQNQMTLEDSLLRREKDIPADSRPWLKEVTSGSLRWYDRLFALTREFAQKPPKGKLKRILAVALYQMIVQPETPAALVVSETVDLIKKELGSAPAGFANHLLRRVSENAKTLSSRSFPTSTEENLNALASLPSWIWEELLKDLTPEEAWAFAMTSLDRPPIWQNFRDPTRSPEKIEQRGPVHKLPGYDSGEWIIQDISSQTVVSEAMQTLQEKGLKSPRILDLCAAPGGKSIALTWAGAKVHATDIKPKRLEKLKQSVQRVNAPVEIVPWNDSFDLSGYDAIWIDAPCTGTGVIRRHPEGRHLRKKSHLKELLDTQASLLKQTWEKMNSGQYLIYSVCSVLSTEGPEQAQSIPGASSINEWRFSPSDPSQPDGFWATLLQKC